MNRVIIKNGEKQSDNEQIEFIGNYILAAMDIEDKILESTYFDYLDRNKWPEELNKKAFSSIIKLLKLLIDETREHHRMFLDLQNKMVLNLANRTKDDIIRDFQTMKLFEESARDYYLKVQADPEIRDESVRRLFKSIANDEQRHVKAVEKIINIIKNSLY